MTVLGFTLAISVVWGLLFSLAPTTELLPGGLARHARSIHTRADWPWRAGGNCHGGGLRAGLVVVQIALSVVLLIGAGLLARAFVEVQQVDPGFETNRHLTFRVALPDSRYRSADALVAAAGELRRRLGTLRGVTGAGAISHLPYDDLPNWF